MAARGQVSTFNLSSYFIVSVLQSSYSQVCNFAVAIRAKLQSKFNVTSSLTGKGVAFTTCIMVTSKTTIGVTLSVVFSVIVESSGFAVKSKLHNYVGFCNRPRSNVLRGTPLTLSNFT